MKRKNRQIHYKTAGFKPTRLTAILILAGLIVAASAAGLLYYRNLNRFVFTEDMVYSIDGISYYYGPKDKAVIERDGTVSLIASGSNAISAESLPVYYMEKDSILTVCPMAYYSGGLSPGTNGVQLERFTVLDVMGESINISFRKNHYAEQGSFLYDGEDTYVLLAEATLNIGSDRSLRLSPLSYVIAVYDSYIMYYDYASDSFEYVTFDFGEAYQEVSIEFDNGSVLNCDFDMFITGSTSVLLPSAVSRMQTFF